MLCQEFWDVEMKKINLVNEVGDIVKGVGKKMVKGASKHVHGKQHKHDDEDDDDGHRSSSIRDAHNVLGGDKGMKGKDMKGIGKGKDMKGKKLGGKIPMGGKIPIGTKDKGKNW